MEQAACQACALCGGARFVAWLTWGDWTNFTRQRSDKQMMARYQAILRDPTLDRLVAFAQFDIKESAEAFAAEKLAAGYRAEIAPPVR